jgi:beta-lactamase regulating signal transducer with metallopeptidase domain
VIGIVVAAALWALVASLLLSLVLGLLVAGVIASTRPAAATRGALWSVALAAAGFAPVVILAVMLVRGAIAGPAPASPRPAATVAHRAATAAAPHAVAYGAAQPGQLRALRVPGPPDVTPFVAAGIAAVWALGALIGLAGLGRSVARVRGLKGRSSPLDGMLATELPWLTTTPGREIYLRLSYETETPIAVGFRRPVILLPTEMATADGLTSIEPLIMHEYAHLARYDDWANLAQRVTERLFWFNPLVWFLGRRIALEREVAADEAVVLRTRDAKVYASTLWRMAQEMRMPEHVAVAPGAMLTRKQISVRIERLLDEPPAGTRPIGAAAFALTLLAVTGVAALAATAPPIVLAEAAPFAAPVDVAPLILERVTPPVVAPARPSIAPLPKPPAMHEIRKIIVLASPIALPSEAQQAISDSVSSAVDSAIPGMGQQIQAEVQHRIGDVMTRHNFVGLDETHGSVTRELIGRCIGCDFSRRDLHGMDFSGLTLIGDDFSYVNLTGANFHGAKLTGLDLSHANLDNADLSDATITGVDLSRASMNGTDTAGMRFIGSSLP